MNPSITPPPPTFTAARIAEVLGVDVGRVEKLLAGSPPAAMDGGRRAWALVAMSSRLRQELDKRALVMAYSCAEALLMNFAPDWEGVPPAEKRAAAKLCRALRKPIQERDRLFPQELARLGVEEYRKVHGYVISEPSWWKRFKAVLQRADGKGQFDRLHLYLPERAPARAPRSSDPDLARLFSPLEADIQAVSDPTNPTVLEKQNLRRAAMTRYRSIIERGRPGLDGGLILAELARYLAAAVPGWIRGGKPELLRRELKDLTQGRRSITDLRSRSGRRRYSCPPCEEQIQRMFKDHPEPAIAWREAWIRGLLCGACRAHFSTYDIRRAKSAYPRSFVDRLKLNKITRAALHSDREARIAGAHSRRLYQGVLYPGDVFVYDDMTTNERVAVSQSGGRWEFFKVQIIVASDMASAKFLDFDMRFGHPRAWSVRTLQQNLFTNDAIGMPRKGQHLERGVFKARLITETAAGGAREDEIPWRETEDLIAAAMKPGFELTDTEEILAGGDEGGEGNEFREVFENLRIVHARLPMAKTIEGDFLILQRRARTLPGHMGFNERFGKRDRLRDFMNRCRVGKADPREEGILTIEELCRAYRDLMEEYNAEPNGGARCRGNSPDEVWGAHVPTHPLDKLPGHMSYIFASVRRRVPVGEHGIVIRDKQIDPHQPQVYYSEATGRALLESPDRKVEVRYNPHRPEVLWMKSEAGGWLSVPRQALPAWGASREEIRGEQRSRWNHNQPSVALAGNLRHPSGATIERDSDFSDEQHDFGREVAEAETRIAEDGREHKQQASRLRRAALEHGLVPVANLHTAQGQQAQRLLLKAARLRAEKLKEKGGVDATRD